MHAANFCAGRKCACLRLSTSIFRTWKSDETNNQNKNYQKKTVYFTKNDGTTSGSIRMHTLGLKQKRNPANNIPPNLHGPRFACLSCLSNTPFCQSHKAHNLKSCKCLVYTQHLSALLCSRKALYGSGHNCLGRDSHRSN